MQITKPKAILQKVLPLFLSLAMLAGLLPVSPLGTMLINDAEARACRKRSQRRSRGSRPQGSGRGWSPGQCRGRHPAELCAHRQRLGGRGSPPGLRRRPPGRTGLCGSTGGSRSGDPTAAARLSVPCQWAPGPWLIAGATYYVASGVYYRPVYEGSEVVYQQVPNPQ